MYVVNFLFRALSDTCTDVLGHTTTRRSLRRNVSASGALSSPLRLLHHLVAVLLLLALPPPTTPNPCYDCYLSDGRRCVSFPRSDSHVDDGVCKECALGLDDAWPCDVDFGLCWCWDTGRPRIPPALPSGLEVASPSGGGGAIVHPCDMLTQPLYDHFLAPLWEYPFTYSGLCDAIDVYNDNHDEKAFLMGSDDERRKSEFGAFLGHALHATGGLQANRDVLLCGDTKKVDGRIFCKPCAAIDYDAVTGKCSESLIAGVGAEIDAHCVPDLAPPDGCECRPTLGSVQQSSTGVLAGYFLANHDYFGRGVLQMRWSVNYAGASVALTGNLALCDIPDAVAVDPVLAWGSAIYLWMERVVDGTTAHTTALEGSFGGTVNIISGPDECPVREENVEHATNRIDQYCHAAATLRSLALLDFGGCEGLADVYEACKYNGGCPSCRVFIETGGDGVVDVPAPTDTPTEVPSPSPVRPPTTDQLTAEPTAEPTGAAPVTLPGESSQGNADDGYPAAGGENPPSSHPPASRAPSSPNSQAPAPVDGVPDPLPLSEREGTGNREGGGGPSSPPSPLPACDEEPCKEQKHCRNVHGFCGSGRFFCNPASTWNPDDCLEHPLPTVRPTTGNPTRERTSIPTRSPVPEWWGVLYEGVTPDGDVSFGGRSSNAAALIGKCGARMAAVVALASYFTMFCSATQ